MGRVVKNAKDLSDLFSVPTDDRGGRELTRVEELGKVLPIWVRHELLLAALRRLFGGGLVAVFRIFDCRELRATTLQEVLGDVLGHNGGPSTPLFGLHAAWLRFANEMDLRTLAKLHVRIESKKASMKELVTSATYAGLEPNLYGDVETRYARSFARRFLKEGYSLSNCGVTIVPKKSAQKDIPTDLITELEKCAGPRSPDPRR